MKFRALVLELHLPQNFCHRHTDRHFSKIVKSYSGQPKTCKSIKNRKFNICTKPIFSSTYVEESKKFYHVYITGNFMKKGMSLPPTLVSDVCINIDD